MAGTGKSHCDAGEGNTRGCEFIMMLRGVVVRSCPRPAAAPNDAGDPHRREILIKLLAAALTTVTGQSVFAATLPLGRDRFLELSEKLCAMTLEDRSLADAIQNVLLDQYAADDFRRLAELLHSATPEDVDRLVAGSGLHDLARSIVSIWYSGLLGIGERTRLLAYEGALAWRATGYAKAPGTCGEFGDWIAKPQTALDRERRL
jgi:hypothetical protein